MLKDKSADTKPQDNKESFEDLVGEEQSADKSSVDITADKSDTPTGEQSDPKPEIEDEESTHQPGESSNQKEEKPKSEETQQPSTEEKQEEGEQPFWGKFKTEDDAKKSYDEAQSKIIEQGKELNELKKSVQENEDFLGTLDKALLNDPDLADQLKSVIAGEMKDKEDEEPAEGVEDKEDDLDTKIDKKFEERENRAKIKTEREAWIKNHPDFKNPDLGHKVLDLLEEEGLPFTAKTLDIAYNYITKDQQQKKAKDEAVKKEEVADLERQEASSVGGGEPLPKGKTPQDNLFDNLVGDTVNPNIVRT